MYTFYCLIYLEIEDGLCLTATHRSSLLTAVRFNARKVLHREYLYEELDANIACVAAVS
jgi:hypothetical protein